MADNLILTCIDLYLKDIKPKVEPTTYKTCATCMRVFESWLESQHINRPIWIDIQNYKRHLIAIGKNATTIHTYFRQVKAFFKWAEINGIYPDVARNVKNVDGEKFTTHRDSLDLEAVHDISKKIDTSTTAGKRLYAIFLLCAFCGLRTIEVSRARIQDMKVKDGNRYLYVCGKGHKVPDTPVLLPQIVVAAIDTYLAELAPYYRMPMAPLFCSTSNRSMGKRIAPTTISTQIKSAMIAAGYDSSRITAHSLRNTAATLLFEKTHDIRLVQHFLRHKTPAEVAIYVN